MKEQQNNTVIRFIQLTEDLAIDNTDIRLPKGIVLPVEVPKGVKKLEAEHVTLPAIMSGMVQAIAEDHKESDTYRKFLSAAWPELESDMTKTGIAKIHQKDPEGAFPFFYNAYKYSPQPNSCINLSNCYRAIAELAADNKDDETETKSWLSARHTLLEGLDKGHQLVLAFHLGYALWRGRDLFELGAELLPLLQEVFIALE